MHLVASAFLYINKGILTTNGLFAVKVNLQFSIKDIESLLHIRMHVSNSGFICFEFSYCYLCERATGLIAGEKNTLLSNSM